MYDGINMKTCKSGPGITFTYTAGTVIGGLAEKFKLEKKKEHLDLAHNITMAAFKYGEFRWFNFHKLLLIFRPVFDKRWGSSRAL